jgi:exo-1,4-beta-D-glucosaminidase
MRWKLRRCALPLCSATLLTIAAALLAAPLDRSTAETKYSTQDIRAKTQLAIEFPWQMQSSAKVADGGETISVPGYSAAGWYRLAGPETVLAGLVENGVYPEPTIGKNLRQIPGASYPIGVNFSNREMPEDSPFRSAWWYRWEFLLLSDEPGYRSWLYLDGVNYRANVWVNGKRIATADEIVGAYRTHELDITAAARPGKTNALALEIFSPRAKDLAITFVDWNPMPPDKNMGLWRDVRIGQTGPVAIRHPYVASRLDLPALDAAHLTLSADLDNGSDRAAEGLLEATIEGIRVSKPVAIPARKTLRVTFSPREFPALNLAHPRIWWPYGMGLPQLYEAKFQFFAPGADRSRMLLDTFHTKTVTFGISQITSELTPEGYRLFRVNGRKLLVRGAAWTPDILQRRSRERLEAEFRYVRDMNLNTIRLEGKMDDDEFFDLADRMGILILPGWCCCDAWQKSAQWDAENRRVAAASLTDQLLQLRNHPSVLVWMNGSDEPPAPDVERMYLDIEKKLNWPRPALSAASNRRTDASGPTGVKMEGPYDYVPPVYWYTDRKNGGAFGLARAQPSRKSRACAASCPRTSCGPSMTPGNFTAAADSTKTSGTSQRTWRHGMARQPASRILCGRPRRPPTRASAPCSRRTDGDVTPLPASSTGC